MAQQDRASRSSSLPDRRMAVREFTDSKGREWRAWDVNPDELNPRTKDEDYLAQLYHTGWIVFETRAGDDKRRLYPIPTGWHELPDPQLEVLLQKAEVVPQRKLQMDKQATGADAALATQRAADLIDQMVENPELVRESVREETPDVTDLGVVRTFRYPGGRIWMACVVDRGAGSSVLRFTAGARSIDLLDWPKDWADYPDAALVDLLRRAAPRATASSTAAGAPQRRSNDPPAP